MPFLGGLGSSLHCGNWATCLDPEEELKCPREVDNKYPQAHRTRTHPLAFAELGADFKLFKGQMEIMQWHNPGLAPR